MSGNSKTGIWVAAAAIGLAAAVSWTASGVTPSIHFDEEGGTSISKVHGSINVPDNGRAGSVKTVNGSVGIGDGAEVDRIKVVNGSIRIGEKAVVHDEAKSVNGSISLDAGVLAEGDIGTVNGRIDIDRGAVVNGGVSTVNGRMELTGAEAGSLTTTNGDIHLEDGTVIHGDVRVEKPEHEGWSLFGDDRPRVVIGENCEVRGKLVLEQEVELEVADSAKIGAIEGVDPVRR